MSEIMSNEYPELKSMLEKFTISVMKNKPDNLEEYAVVYFQKLIRETGDKSEDDDKDYDSLDEDYNSADDVMTDRQAKKMLMRISDVPRQTIFGESFDPSLVKLEEFEAGQKIHSKTPDQLMKIQQILSTIFLFKSLDEVQLRKVIDSMFPVEYEAGDVVIRENDPGDNFYLVEYGEFIAKNESGTISEKYSNEGFFGELALMYNCPRKATITAETYGKLWAIDRKSFKELILKGAYDKRKRLENFVKKVEILTNLSEYDRSNLADALKSRVFTNECIIKEGELGDRMFFIDEGEVMVTQKDKDGFDQEVKRLYSGDYFGEVALVDRIPRIASVHAVGTVKLEELDNDSYIRLMGPCIPEMRKNYEKYNFSQT